MEQEDQMTFDGLADYLGEDSGAPAQDETPAPTGAETGSGNQEPPSDEDKPEEPAEDKGGKDNAPEPEVAQKQAYAFAAMRKEMSEQKELIKQLGAALGLKGTDKEIFAGLQEKVTQKQAKDANVSPEMMAKINHLESQLKERDAKDRELQTYAQIQQFQSAMHIDNKSRDEFLTRLAQKGINPFTQDVDLKKEYIYMNWEQMLKEAGQKALQGQAKLDQKAAEHGTTPSAQTGGGEHKPSEINTPDDLEEFLKANVK